MIYSFKHIVFYEETHISVLRTKQLFKLILINDLNVLLLF